MTTTIASRSILLALGLGFILATACFDESVIENEDCASNADCANNQECVRTDYQAGTPSQFGWCRPEGDGCAAGQQPGCECAVSATTYTCESVDNVALCPTMQDATCTCVFPKDVGGMETDTTCPQ